MNSDIAQETKALNFLPALTADRDPGRFKWHTSHPPMWSRQVFMSHSHRPLPLAADQVVVITGGHGLLGKALQAELRRRGFTKVLAPRRQELNFLDGAATRAYFMESRPHIVFHLASVVFGLLGNMEYQIRAISESTILNHNVLMASAEAKVRKFFFAGSVACYPFPYKSLPLTEDTLWDGLPHPGELGYAHAKRHGLAYLEILSQNVGLDFFFGLLTNIYGPEDRFDEIRGHVIPSLMRKMYRAKHFGEPFRVWGDGSATRDFIQVNDAASAILFGMERFSGVANISSGTSVSIREIVDALVKAANYKMDVIWETDKPVGVPERSVSDAILRGLGFRCTHDLEAGIRETWEWFEQNVESART